jgi:AraC-like DNA-binding protein
MLAALQGIAPDDVSLTSPRLELPPEVVARTRRRIIDILDQCSREDVPGAMGREPLKLADEIFSLAGDIYLGSRINLEETEPRSSRSPERIVRMAEEYFFAADGEPISLADLCKATGVGKTTLYNAFANICGVPPLSYFHKRRLMQARSTLLNSDATWGAVKRAALSAGLTELGRFSVEYRQLFGESPSATLRQVQ